MNPAHEPYQKLEIDFVAETYPDANWSIKEIAEKLECSEMRVYNIASSMGLKRPYHKLDYAKIVELRKNKLSLRGIAKVLGCSKGGVQRALRIEGMS